MRADFCYIWLARISYQNINKVHQVDDSDENCYIWYDREAREVPQKIDSSDAFPLQFRLNCALWTTLVHSHFEGFTKSYLYGRLPVRSYALGVVGYL